MAQLKPIRIDQFEGGLSLKDDTLIDDNQLSVATNMFYNNEKKLQTRYGQSNFGSSIPDAVAVISACDVTTNWTVSEDADTLTAEATLQKRGAGALKFNITVAGTANDYGLLTNSSLSLDVSSANGFVLDSGEFVVFNYVGNSDTIWIDSDEDFEGIAPIVLGIM